MKNTKTIYDKHQNIWFIALLFFGILTSVLITRTAVKNSEAETNQRLENINSELQNANADILQINADLNDLNNRLIDIETFLTQDKAQLLFESSGAAGTNAGYQTQFDITDVNLNDFSYLYAVGMIAGASIKTTFVIDNGYIALHSAKTFQSIVALPDTATNTTFYYVSLRVSHNAENSYSCQITNIRTYNFKSDGTTEVISGAPSGQFMGFHLLYGIR